MVNLNIVHAANNALVTSQPLVAVFVGGTSGIGDYAVRALSAAHGKNGKGLRLYVVGRNETAGKSIIDDCQKLCPTAQFRFVKVNDLALMNDVDRACETIINIETEAAKAKGEKARIDLLIQSQGVLLFKRKDTKEGIDTFMSLLYYSRVRFILQLLPLLLESSLPAHIVSVYGPGRDKSIIPDDLSLRDPKVYGFMNSGSHVAYMTTFFFEQLAAKHPGKLSLVHYFPGIVITPAYYDKTLPLWSRIVWSIIGPLVRRFAAVEPKESGERTIFNCTPRYPPRSSSADLKPAQKTHDGLEIASSSDGVVGGGAYRSHWNNGDVPMDKKYPKLRDDGMSEKVWKHTMRAFEVIEKGGVFTE